MTRFAGDEDGAILVFFAMLLAVFMGFMALSFDFGQQAATQSELQSYADNVALAAAGELDGAPTSLTRAQAAAATFITDAQTFGDGGRTLAGAGAFTLTFYANRRDAAAGINPETRPQRVRFVRATLAPRRVGGTFSRAFAALAGTEVGPDTVSAQAIAGYSLYACNATPLTFCAADLDFKADLSRGVNLSLKINPGAGNLVPGTLSLVENTVPLVDVDGVCKLLSGISLDLCLLGARGQKTACLAQDGIDIAAGDRQPVIKAGLNVRFDIFGGSALGLRNNPVYAPAANVLSSYVPRSSSQTCLGNDPRLATDRMGFPKDDCQTAGGCGIFGNASWASGRAAFVARNFGGTDPFPQASTRFEFYNAMVAAQANGSAGGLVGGLLGGLGGTLNTLLGLGLPTCAPAADPDPNRRVLIAAAIDCTGISATANLQDVPVLDFVELFMTAPTGLDGGNTVNVEVIGSLKSTTRPKNRDVVVRDVVRLMK